MNWTFCGVFNVQGLLGFNACALWIPMFRRNVLPTFTFECSLSGGTEEHESSG